MNKYEALADTLLEEMRKDDFKSETVTIRLDVAVKIYNALSGMNTIMKVMESDYGGAELLR
jgi:hypothetical protein